MSLFCNMGLYFIPSFAIILLKKRDREVFFQMFSSCNVAVSALYLFLVVPCVCMWSLIVAFLIILTCYS